LRGSNTPRYLLSSTPAFRGDLFEVCTHEVCGVCHSISNEGTGVSPFAGTELNEGAFGRDPRELMLVTGPPFWALLTLLALMAC
jgi:hypothetical protein